VDYFCSSSFSLVMLLILFQSDRDVIRRKGVEGLAQAPVVAAHAHVRGLEGLGEGEIGQGFSIF